MTVRAWYASSVVSNNVSDMHQAWRPVSCNVVICHVFVVFCESSTFSQEFICQCAPLGSQLHCNCGAPFHLTTIFLYTSTTLQTRFTILSHNILSHIVFGFFFFFKKLGGLSQSLEATVSPLTCSHILPPKIDTTGKAAFSPTLLLVPTGASTPSLACETVRQRERVSVSKLFGCLPSPTSPIDVPPLAFLPLRYVVS